MSGTEPLTADDPRQLGGYTLTARLGQGGQGVVYLGQDDSDGSTVAVKTLHSDGIDAAGMRRQLAEEIETARRVARFCTAQVLAADVEAAPPYVVSEYIEGPTLREVVRRDGPMRGAALERLAVGTLTALAAIHQAGIVHRDFKPGNVLMGPGGPRVIDFGIARALEGTAILTSQIAGTPAYMAPEQVAGEALGPAVDLFSWGSTMVFAANGWGPFGQDSLHQVLHNVSNEEADLGALEGRLRDIAARCLSKDPAQRPSAAETLMGVLGVAMADPPADDGPEPEPDEEPGSLPIHTLAAGAVAAAAPEARESTAAEFRDSLPEKEIEAAAAEEGLFRSYPPTAPPASGQGPGYAPGPPQAPPAAPSGPQTPPGAGGGAGPWAPPGGGSPSGPQQPQPGPTAPPPAPMPPTGGQPPAPPSGPQSPYGPGPGRPPSGPQPPNASGPAVPPSGPQSPYGPGQQPAYGPGPGAPSPPGGPPPAAAPQGPAAGTGPAPTGAQPGYGPAPSVPPSGPQPPYGPAPGAPASSGPQPSYGPAPGAPGPQPPSPYGPGAPPQPGAPAGPPVKSSGSGSGGAGVIIGVVAGASILVVIAVVIIIVVIIGG